MWTTNVSLRFELTQEQILCLNSLTFMDFVHRSSSLTNTKLQSLRFTLDVRQI